MFSYTGLEKSFVNGMSGGSVSIIKRVELLQNRRPRPQVNIT